MWESCGSLDVRDTPLVLQVSATSERDPCNDVNVNANANVHVNAIVNVDASASASASPNRNRMSVHCGLQTSHVLLFAAWDGATVFVQPHDELNVPL